MWDRGYDDEQGGFPYHRGRGNGGYGPPRNRYDAELRAFDRSPGGRYGPTRPSYDRDFPMRTGPGRVYGTPRNPYDREFRGPVDHEMMRREYGGRDGRTFDRYSQPYRGDRSRGGDYWWIGEHEFRRRPASYDRYDEAYRRFSDEHHPRFSPVGGMYGPFGGRYAEEGPPRPLRDYARFSDWTRWF